MDRFPQTFITATIGNFCDMADIGRSKVYELLDAGDLDSIKIGKRRLIIVDSYRKLIEQQRAAAQTETGNRAEPPTPEAPTAPSRRGRPREIRAQSPQANHSRR